jgi:hypothetical protein
MSSGQDVLLVEGGFALGVIGKPSQLQGAVDAINAASEDVCVGAGQELVVLMALWQRLFCRANTSFCAALLLL